MCGKFEVGQFHFKNVSRLVHEHLESTFGLWKSFQTKAEVEIWRKPEKNELAAIDFLLDPNTMYGSIGHRFDVTNYFRCRRNRKYWNSRRTLNIQRGALWIRRVEWVWNFHLLHGLRSAVEGACRVSNRWILPYTAGYSYYSYLSTSIDRGVSDWVA